MKTNKEFDIVPYIAIIGLTIAMFTQVTFLHKMEAKYIQARQTIKDLTFVVDCMVENINELETELSELNSKLDTHVVECEEAMELSSEAVAYSEPIIEEPAKPEFDYDYDYVLRVVAAESRGEPFEGQMAVAQCIRETANATGQTPEAVVKQVSSTGVRQYTTPVSIDLVTDSVREACERVFINGESVTDEPIRYFYSIRNGGYSKWHENSLTYVLTIGNHKFFKK